ncbi:MAG TPA: extracellular solute-binding protein [Candidatus Hydrogenedentes bacterium]|nr:extracellular solute-binding protein [Candidatus Hydrogenedentota bacterium]
MKHRVCHGRTPKKRRAAMIVFASALALAGCMREQTLAPAEALNRASERIDRILARHDGETEGLDRSADADDPPENRAVIWHYAHPLISPAFAPNGSFASWRASHAPFAVETQFLGDWGAAVQKLTVSLAAGDLPDIALVKRSWLAALAHSGRLQPLDGYLPDALTRDLHPVARASMTVHGRLYALPADGFCSALFCRSDRVSTPPRTWDELRAVAKELRGGKEKTDRFWPVGHYPFLEALWSAGGNVVKDGKAALNDPEALEALEFVLSLTRRGDAPRDAMLDPDAGMQRFLRGEVAMTVASSAYLPTLRQADVAFTVAPVPGKNGPISMLSDDAIVAFRRHAAARREAIAATLDFLASTAGDARAMARGSVPIRNSADAPGAYPSLCEAYACARNTPLIRAWAETQRELRVMLANASTKAHPESVEQDRP